MRLHVLSNLLKLLTEMTKKIISLKNSKKTHFLIVYVVLAILMTLLWFDSADFLIYIDTNFPLINLAKYLERIFTIPDTGYFLSSYDIRHLILYTYAIPFTPFSSFWSLQIASLFQRTMCFSLLFASLVSFSYFLFYIGKTTNHEISYFALLICALVYCFNTYAAIIIWRPFMPYVFHYSLFPLFMTLSLQYFSTNNKKYLLGLMLLSFLIFPAYTIAHSLIFDFLVIVILLFAIKNELKKTMCQFLFTLMKIFSGFLILSIPLILVLISEPSLIIAQYESTAALTRSPEALIDLLKYNSPTMVQALIYSGYPPLYTSHYKWYASYSVYFEPFLIIFLSALFCLGFLLGTKRNGCSLWLEFAIIWILSLFMFTGSNDPLSDLKIIIFQIKFLDLMRSVYARFGEYVILSSLPFAFLGLSRIFRLRKSLKYKATIFILTVLLLVAPIFPVLNADFLRAQNPIVPSNQVVFPNSYMSLSTLDDSQRTVDYLYLTIPSSFVVSRRIWSNETQGYIGPDIFPFILNGASVKTERIRNNVLNLILRGEFTKLQQILPIKYIILTFDHKTSSFVENQTVYNYLSTFQRILEVIYIDENLSVFKLPINVKNNWRLLFLDCNKSIIAEDIFSNSYYPVVYRNLPYDASYIDQNYIGKALDFTNLNIMKIYSSVYLKEKNETYYIYPIFIVLPKVTERLYLALEFKPAEKSWNVYSGVWSAESLRWNYTFLSTTKANNISFIVDFTTNDITIESNSSKAHFPFPQEWTDVIGMRFGNLNETTKNLGGEIGIFAGGNLSQLSFINELIVECVANKTDVSISSSTISIINSERIAPTLFKATINVSEPFTLALLEAYDPKWKASVNGQTIDSRPLYDIINGFWINQTGRLEITIEYEPQRWFYIGCAISLTTFIACTTYLTYSYVKSKLKSKERRGSTPYQQKQPIFPSP